MVMRDRVLTCASCGLRFLDTLAEQRERAARGEDAAPAKCPGCRALEALVARRRGTVTWYDPRRGYGFLRDDAGDDVFVHVSQLREAGLARLRSGQALVFEVQEGPRGPQAAGLALASEGEG